MKTLVRDFESNVALMLRMRSASVVESSAEVYEAYLVSRLALDKQRNRRTASSKKSSLGSFNKTLATANLCFSPPLIINPLSPTLVLYLSGKLSIVLETFANLAASLTSSSVASNRPYRMFSRMSEWNKPVS